MVLSGAALPAGVEAYRPVLLKKVAESPNAAVHALRFIDDLGDHQPRLRASAAELFNSVDTIDKFEFDNDGVYVAYFAMKWVNNGTTYQVTARGGPVGRPRFAMARGRRCPFQGRLRQGRLRRLPRSRVLP